MAYSLSQIAGPRRRKKIDKELKQEKLTTFEKTESQKAPTQKEQEDFMDAIFEEAQNNVEEALER